MARRSKVLSFNRRLRREGWPPAPRARYKDESSSGPSPGDTSASAIGLGGGGSSPSSDANAAFAYNAQNPSDIGFGSNLFNFTMPFSADSGGGFSLPSFSSGSDGGGVPTTASIGTPGGFTAPGASGAVGAAALAPPAGGGAGATDFSSEYDPFKYASTVPGIGNQGTGGFTAPGGGSSGAALSPEQLGQPPAGGQPAATPAAQAGGGGSSILESLGIKNPLGTAIGLGGLGYAIAQGQQQQKYSPELQAQAARLDANGQKLMSYLQSGNLPPGLKASLDQATASAKAKVVSNFAAQGLNTDPTRNTALAAQLAQIDQQAIISTAQMGQQLMQSGIAESGLSSDLYKTLANIDQTQTAAIGKAIANFASAMGGGSRGTNFKIG